MPRDDRYNYLARSLKSFQDTVRQAGPAAAAAYTLTGAIVVLGGGGYALDAWLGTSPAGLVAGLIVGLLVGFYVLARTTWHR
jgi:F0F1-type ATP synthase assembly protein I